MSKVGEQAGKVGGWQSTEGLSSEATGSHCRLLLWGNATNELFSGKVTLVAGLGITGGDGAETLRGGPGTGPAPCQRNTNRQMEGALAGGWWASEGEPWVASCSSGAPGVKAGWMDPTGQYPQAPGLKLAPKPASALLVGLLQLRDWVQGGLRSSTLPSLPGCNRSSLSQSPSG